MNFLRGLLHVVICNVMIESAPCEEFFLPDDAGDSLIGEIAYTVARKSDTLLDIARIFDIGHDQIIAANPGVNRWIPPPGRDILIPSRYILPPGPRVGIVLNLAELRLYYFPPHSDTVFTYPVSIGDLDWRTPIGTTKVIAKERNPSWVPPASIRAEHRAEGDELPPMIPGGDPDNPLGEFALKLGFKSYLIHGTDERRSFGIGLRVSHGCIRMYPEDIEELFYKVSVGTPVRIVDKPIKVGWKDGVLFLEVHRPADSFEERMALSPDFEQVVQLLRATLSDSDKLDAEAVVRVFELGNGIPIGVAVRRLR